jgi:hypothetical protein
VTAAVGVMSTPLVSVVSGGDIAIVEAVRELVEGVLDDLLVLLVWGKGLKVETESVSQ